MRPNELKLIIFESFLGAITAEVRAIAYDYNEDTIIIHGYFDSLPNENDYEIIDIAVTEIMASCPFFTKQQIHLSQSGEPIGNLSYYKGWIFLRYEE